MQNNDQSNVFNLAAGNSGGGPKSLNDMKYADVVAEIAALDAEKQGNGGTVDAAKAERYNALVELHGKMEECMAGIDADPSNIDSIIEYGSAAIKEMEKATYAMIRVQGVFSTEIDKAAGLWDKTSDSDFVQQIEQVQQNVKAIISDALEIDKARQNGAEHVSLHVNCTDEIIRRYDEKYIAEAKAASQSSGSADDAAYLKKVEGNFEDFLTRAEVLLNTQIMCALAQEQLQCMVETIESQSKILDDVKSSFQRIKPQGPTRQG